MATAPITRDTSAVGWTMSSINSLTARSLLSQPPLAPRTRARWVILPSLPTTFERRSNSWVIDSFMPTTSLKRLAISPSTPSTSSGRRTVKSPRRSARRALTSWRRSIKSRWAWMFTLLSGRFYSPRPGCSHPRPPGRADPYYRSKNPFRFVKYYYLQSSARPTQVSQGIRRLEMWRRGCLLHFVGGLNIGERWFPHCLPHARIETCPNVRLRSIADIGCVSTVTVEQLRNVRWQLTLVFRSF